MRGSVKKRPPGFFGALPGWRALLLLLLAVPAWLVATPAERSGVPAPWNLLLAAALFVAVLGAVLWVQRRPR
jgi:hypothetical protein